MHARIPAYIVRNDHWIKDAAGGSFRSISKGTIEKRRRKGPAFLVFMDEMYALNKVVSKIHVIKYTLPKVTHGVFFITIYQRWEMAKSKDSW